MKDETDDADGTDAALNCFSARSMYASLSVELILPGFGALRL
jgi:hypothetical protein